MCSGPAENAKNSIYCSFDAPSPAARSFVIHKVPFDLVEHKYAARLHSHSILTRRLSFGRCSPYGATSGSNPTYGPAQYKAVFVYSVEPLPFLFDMVYSLAVEDTVEFLLTKFQSHEGIFEGIMNLQSQCFYPVPTYACSAITVSRLTPARSDRGGLVAFPGSYLNNRLSNLGDFSMDL